MSQNNYIHVSAGIQRYKTKKISLHVSKAAGEANTEHSLHPVGSFLNTAVQRKNSRCPRG